MNFRLDLLLTSEISYLQNISFRWETAHRLQKKNNKQKHNNGDQMQKAADASLAEVSKQLKNLQETEKNAVRKVLIEERLV